MVDVVRHSSCLKRATSRAAICSASLTRSHHGNPPTCQCNYQRAVAIEQCLLPHSRLQPRMAHLHSTFSDEQRVCQALHGSHQFRALMSAASK